MINDDYKNWKLTTESFSLVTSCSTSDMKYGRIPRRSTMFIAPFTNLRDFNIIFCNSNLFFNQHVGSRNNLQILPRPNFERKSTLCSHLDLCGAAMNLTTYSKENQPTKTASAISKKYSSPESCLLQSLILWLIWLFEIMMIKFDSSPAFKKINQRKRLFISIFNQKHKDFLIYSSPKESFKCLKVWFLWNNSIVFLPSNCWRLGAKTRLILWRCKQFSKLK